MCDSDILEPVAIIGLAFRFPQGAVDEDSFWEKLMNKECTSTEFPKDRLNVNAFHNPSPKRMGTIRPKQAHFLRDDIREFDAPFFNISPSEAASLDPQQRGLLETTYHAIENAGIRLVDIAGSNTSVHVGSFCNDYMTFVLRDEQRIPTYNATGCSQSLLSNRISWAFDLQGTSLTLDTACSSGLVALDLACREIWSGRSSTAICAASNVIFSPENLITLSNMNFLSPDGKCFSFDHRGNGYAKGEGFATLVLKPVSQALRDGDSIRALIRSTGSNQDGHTTGGITQPSKELQRKLIQETYRMAGLDMSQTRFFEAHGTGTAVGDPLEARAIGESFGRFRSEADPLFVGAVKSNLGHLEGASGLAGVIKVVLALEKGVIPPNTNFEKLNPNIDDEYFHLKFPSRDVPWPVTEAGIRRASVNSFGYGGTNAHVVLDDAQSYLRSRALKGHHYVSTPSPQPIDLAHTELAPTFELQLKKDSGYSSPLQVELPTPRLLVLSASDEAGIDRQAEAHHQYLSTLGKDTSSALLNDYAHALASRRDAHTWKSFCLINSLSEVQGQPLSISKPTRGLPANSTLGFVFTGQGAQWYGMARELISCPKFRQSIDESQSLLEKLGWRSLLADLLTNSTHAKLLNQAQYSQVLTTCIQIALIDLFKWLNLTPSVVVGHSSGEISAAYCAGYLNHKSALKISFYRGLLSSVLEKDTSSRHAMAAVGLSVEDIRAEIAEFEENVTGRTPGSFTISCINSSQSVTIAGPKDPLAELIEHLAEKQIFARLLKVDVGYHSPQMLRIASDYNNLMNTLEPGSIDGRSMMVSSVTSLPIQEHEVCRPEYWVRNMISTVNFLGAVNFCCSKKRDHDMKSLDGSHINQVHVDAWLEIGPHSALQGPLGQILRTAGQKQIIYTSALSRNQSALQSVLAAVGYLHCQNFKIDMRKATSLHCSLEQAHGPIPKCLPPYPFNHSVMYWDEAPANADFRLREHACHDLVGSRIGDLKSQAEAQWRFIIKAEQMPWVQDHKIQGSIVYPAAGTLTMVIEAAKQLLTTKIPVAFELKDVEFPAPVQISSESRGVELRLHLSSSKKSGRPGDINYLFRTFLRGADGSETQVCSGTIQGDFGRTASDVDDGKEDDENLWTLQSEYRNAIKTCTGTLDSSEMYEKMRTGGGLEYGPAFQTLSDVAFNSCTEAIATSLPLPSSVAQTMSSLYTVHPSRLDGLFQLGFSAMNGAGAIKGMIPTRIDRLWIPLTGFGHPETTGEKAYSKATHITERNACFSIAVFDHEDLHLKARIEGLELTAVSSTTDARKVLADAPTICLHVQWKPDLDTMNSIEIQGYCEQAKSSLPAVEWTKTLYDLTHSYSVLALQSLRVREQACDPVAMHPSMRRYTSWLSQNVDMSSVVDSQELDVIVATLPSNVLVDACTTVGQNLLEILLGEINPSELLFQDKAQKARFHEELLAASVSTVGSLTRYLDSLVHKRPDLHFCEIGASSSVMTKIMLDTLANPDIGLRYAEYMVTDADELSLESTRGIFSGVPRVRFQCLNIEQSPLSQGFEKETYDVVVLDVSLCSPQKLDQCIAHVHSLLKPGGKLILKEMTTDRLLAGFVLGLFGDKSSGDQGAEHQIPDITRWNATLREYGFSGTDFAFQDLDDIIGVQWNIMVSTSTNLDITEPSMDAPILVLDRQSAFQQSIAAEVLKSFDSNQGSCMFSLTEAADLAKGSHRDFIVLHELETPLLRDIIEDDFVAVKTLLESAKSIIWAKKSDSTPDYAINEGMMRVSRHENYQTVGVSLALETSSDRSPRELAGQILNVFRQTPKAISNDYEPEYREQDGMLCVNRVVQAKPLDEHLFLSTEKPLADLEIGDKRLKLSIRTPGILDTLEFIEDETMKQPLGPGEIEVEVRAVGVNFKDVMTLLGRVPGIEHLGSEFAGIVTEVGHSVPRFKVGDRVVGAYVDAYRTHARIPFQVAFLIPDDVSFAEAASIPTAFRTAYYCLYNIARLQQGESVLIHRASGGTGQAAVQLAMMTGAKVFATVGSKAKKQLLIDQYGLPEDHILYSRDTSFADGIMRLTQGRGVDVVLNSLSGNLLEASWDIIAPLGRFVEIGLGDALSRQQLPMFPFAKGVSFCSFNLNNFMTEAYFPLHTKLMDSVWSLFTARKIRPSYPMQVHSADKLEDALRWLLGGDSSGKAVIQIDKTSVVPTVMSNNSTFRFSPNATYVVTGGLGGIGRSIARWLCSRGAMNLILITRSGLSGNSKGEEMVSELTSRGVRVDCPEIDITDLAALQSYFTKCSQTIPPIKGCFQSAMVLRDTTLSNMSIDDWTQAIRPKVQGSWNLHECLPPMDFFILLSSVVGVGGNRGQANYAAGSGFEDSFARWRSTHCNQKTISVDLGFVLGEGVVAENDDLIKLFIRRNVVRPNSLTEIFTLFESICDPANLQRSEEDSQIITGMKLPAHTLAQGNEVPPELLLPIFRIMCQMDGEHGALSTVSGQTQSFRALFAAASSTDEGSSIASAALREKLGRILGVKAEELQTDRPLSQYGIDSLVALEIRSWVGREMETDVAIFEVLGEATIDSIGRIVGMKSKLKA